MHSEELRKYLDIINENSEEVLTEGMLQKLAGLALGTVLALGPKIGQADTVYTYFDPGANKMQTVLDMSKVPASAKTVMAVDTDTQQVMLVRSGSPTAQEIKPDPVAVKQAQFTKDTKSISGEPEKNKSQAPQSTGLTAERIDNSIIVSGATIDEIKDKLIDRVTSKTPDAVIDDAGRTLTFTLNNVAGKSFGNALYMALLGTRAGAMDTEIKFTFVKSGDSIKITPQTFIVLKNAFGKIEKNHIPVNDKDYNDLIQWMTKK